MAKKVVTTTAYTDDLTGGKADDTVHFTFDGAAYEIDLSKSNARAFDRALRPYLDAARKVRGSQGKATRRSPKAVARDMGAIRDWAKANGYEVSDRGRVAIAIIEAYEAANS